MQTLRKQRGFIGDLIGGIFSAMGQRSANRTNIRLAREQMAFQERMSNTAIARRMRDMRRSGINPILAGKFDATSPPGALATVGNVGAAGVAGASQMAAARVARETAKNVMQDTALKKAQAHKTQSEDAYTQALTNSEILKAIGISTANDIARLNREIRALQIPGVQAEADMWKWLTQANLEEMTKFMGKAGPTVASLIRIFIVLGRGRVGRSN